MNPLSLGLAYFDGDLVPTYAAGDVVMREGTIFVCGQYPDKAFSLTPDEARAAVATFQPVPIDLEHVQTVLDGKLGRLERVELTPDGNMIRGTVVLPRWLDTVLGGQPCRVSAAWDRATKRLAKLALVLQGRIPDAVLMSAFAQFEGRRNSSTDQQTIQQIHDLTAGLGATCGSGTAPALWAGFTVTGG